MQGLPFDFDITMYDALQDWDNELWYREVLWRYRLFKKLSMNRDLVLKHFDRYSSSLGTFEEFVFDAPLKAKEPFGMNSNPKRLLANLDSPVFFIENKQYKIFDDIYSRAKAQMSKAKPKDASVRFYTMREALNLYDRHADLFSDEYDYNNEQGAAQKLLNLPIHEVEKASLLETECILKIDLSRSKDALLSDFEKFIKEHRKQVVDNFSGNARSLKMEVNSNKRVKWCDDKIIPFIDFILWQIYAGQTLRGDQILNALQTRTDFRTIEKEALALLTPYAMKVLKMQI